MLKVKPFSYHIPRRKGSFQERNRRSGNTSVKCGRSRGSDNLFGIEVLSLLLIGFIGVAGQAKFSEMDEGSHFIENYPSLSYPFSLSNVDESESDEELQRKITSMGQYGSRYRNDSFDSNRIFYKERGPPNELSFKDEMNYSEDGENRSLDENRINEGGYQQFPSITRWTVPNQTSPREILNFVEDSNKDEEDHSVKLLSSFPRESESDPDEFIEERFMPGNTTHISGKTRFRQSSQAEVDGVEEDTLFPIGKEVNRRRPRRSVVHLYDMVVCSTGCNPLIFKGYGCYCGFLGSGLTVDGIDKCCAKHDFCYHHAKCPPLLTYFVPYYWRCDHGRPSCVTDFRGWKGVCGAHLCECDRQFAECLKKFPCPRSRAMCITSPWRIYSSSYSHSHWHTDSPFPFGKRPPIPPWRLPHPRITHLHFPPPPHLPPHPPLLGPIFP